MNLKQYLQQNEPAKGLTVYLKENEFKRGASYTSIMGEKRTVIYIIDPDFLKAFKDFKNNWEYLLINGILYTIDQDGNKKSMSVFRINEKSHECTKVLQLMDIDFKYNEALNLVLNESKINKIQLEKELSIYI